MYKLHDLVKVPDYRIVEDDNVTGLEIGLDQIRVHPQLVFDNRSFDFLSKLDVGQVIRNKMVNKWKGAIENLRKEQDTDAEVLKKLVEKDIPTIIQDYVEVVDVLTSSVGCRVVIRIRQIEHDDPFLIYCKWDDDKQQYVLVTEPGAKGRITAELNKMHEGTEQKIIENAFVSEHSSCISSVGIDSIEQGRFVFKSLLYPASQYYKEVGLAAYDMSEIAKDVYVANERAYIVIPNIRISGAKMKVAINIIGPKPNEVYLSAARYDNIHSWVPIITSTNYYTYEVPQEEAEKQFRELLRGNSSNPLLNRLIQVVYEDMNTNMYMLSHKHTIDGTNSIFLVVKLDQHENIEVLASVKIKKGKNNVVVVFNRQPSEDEYQFVMKCKLALKLSGV